MNRNGKRVVLGTAAVAVVLGTLYAVAFKLPGTPPAAGAAATGQTAELDSAKAKAQGKASHASTARPALPSTPLEEQGASDPQFVESEESVHADGRLPIEERSPEIQQRYHEAWLKGMRRAQDLQRGSLERLEEQKQVASDEQTRGLLEQQIAQRRKLIEERTAQIARHEAEVAPSAAAP